jgi:hypothetical protein
MALQLRPFYADCGENKLTIIAPTAAEIEKRPPRGPLIHDPHWHAR